MNWYESTEQLIRAAVAEDLGSAGDLTARLLANPEETVAAHVVARGAGVVAGLALVPMIGRIVGKCYETEFNSQPIVDDGEPVASGTRVLAISGQRAALLGLERTLLNFLCRLSGVATLTRRFVDQAQARNPAVRILDTRKTIPGWRELDKYAVRCGGGTNHRFGLYDAVLIKDNHIAGIPVERLAGAMFEMLNRLSTGPKPAFVEVEVDSLEQLAEVLKVVGIDFVLLDNFSLEQLRAAVALRDSLGLRGRVALEASGGVNLDTVGDIAATGVDHISVGAITHSAPALDLGLDFA